MKNKFIVLCLICFTLGCHHSNPSVWEVWDQARLCFAKEHKIIPDQASLDHFHSFENRIALLNGRKEANMNDPRQRQFIENQVTFWMVDKYLFERYGGEVIMAKSPLKPIEAYERLFSDQNYAHFFHVVSTGTVAQYLRRNSVTVPHEKAVEYFQSPYWLLSNEKQ